MNGRERFLCALNGGVPDRVPVFDWIDEKVVWGMARLLGWDVSGAPTDGEATRHGEESEEVLRIYCDLIDALDLDATWSAYSTNLVPETSDWGWDKYGRGFMLSDHGIPAIMDSGLKTIADVRNYSMAALVERSDFRMLQYMVDRFGKEKFHLQSINGPFQEGWLARGGMDKSFVDMGADRDMAHAVGRLTTDFNMRCIDIAHDIGADGVILDGDLTGNDYMLMSMEHFREYIKPYKKELIDYGHAKGLKVMKHSDGNMWALMDEMIDLGFDGFHPVQPQCMNLAEVKAWFAGRVCMFGNVDCLDLLVFGTPEMVDAAVRECIEQGSPGGGHILCSSNSLHPGVKPENALAMFRAAKKYGDYARLPAKGALARDDLDIAKLAKSPVRSRQSRNARRMA
ncbi:uroporphyrinogen decarboxylase family protein [Defluviimonas salinarum]|uniref:Uroporphyrinogen decarboxylase (URO-D) domain-containing protein n=1 Tax=Defluviimonas salinarum TaxID=2992147 RepID=A0ABT3J343_9RHOB|nr:uroporphyrinogen decarboxylase family protein [Defluviimonas salinarum]MCW3782107.1 hypothetical protein [Defluviimonas salinarum]